MADWFTENAPAQPATAVPPQTVGRGVSSAAEALNPVTAVKGMAQTVLHPIDSYHAAVEASAKQFEQAARDYQQGHYSEMIGHGAAGVLPGIGPAAAAAGEQIASGDIAGGLGKGAGLALSPIAAEGAGALIKGSLRQTGVGTTLATLRPARALRQDFGGGTAIAKTILDERLPTEAAATAREAASAGELNASLDRLQAQGIGVPSNRVVRGLAPARAVANQDVALGLPDATESLAARARGIHRAAAGQDIPVQTAQALKQRAQELAFEAQQQNLSVPRIANEGVATALREGIEEAGQRGGEPNIGAINARTQRLIGARRAWADANDRPHGLSNMLSVGSGTATGGMRGALGGLAIRALDAPHAGAWAGIGLNELGRVAGSPAAMRAALLAALQGQENPTPESTQTR